MFCYDDAWSLISTGDEQPRTNPDKEPHNFSSAPVNLRVGSKRRHPSNPDSTIGGAWLVTPQNSDKALSTPPNSQLTVEHPAGMIFHEPSHSRGDTLQDFSERFRTTPFLHHQRLHTQTAWLHSPETGLWLKRLTSMIRKGGQIFLYNRKFLG